MDWSQFIQVIKIDERAARAKYRTAAKNEAIIVLVSENLVPSAS